MFDVDTHCLISSAGHWLIFVIGWKCVFFSLSSSSSVQSTVSDWFFFLCFFTLCKHSLSRVVWKCQRHHGRWVGHTYFILSDTCSILCQPPRLCLVPARKRHEKLTMCTLLKYHVQSQRSDKWNPKIDSVALWLCDLFGVFLIVVLFCYVTSSWFSSCLVNLPKFRCSP